MTGSPSFQDMYKMERVVFYGAKANPSLVVENVPLPTIKDGEILGRILTATICGSDIHTLEGKRDHPAPWLVETLCLNRLTLRFVAFLIKLFNKK